MQQERQTAVSSFHFPAPLVASFQAFQQSHYVVWCFCHLSTTYKAKSAPLDSHTELFYCGKSDREGGECKANVPPTATGLITSVSPHEYRWNVKTCLCIHTVCKVGEGREGGGGWGVGNSMAFLNPMIIRWWLAAAINYSV